VHAGNVVPGGAHQGKYVAAEANIFFRQVPPTSSLLLLLLVSATASFSLRVGVMR
jgi:hypothetical protein